jgi:predicted transcriptional regulator of viral defense system
MSAQPSKSAPTPSAFLAAHPVFTHAAFVRAHTANGRSRHTSNALLAGYLASGRLVRIQRGLYATVSLRGDPRRVEPDPYLVACAVREDAVLAYHTALAFHGRAYSVWNRFQFLTAGRMRPFAFRGQSFVPLRPPRQVRKRADFGGGILRRPHAGGEVRVASLERTLVDLMHAPQHGGGFEEIWRSFELVEFLDLAAVLEYTARLGTALTAARVGFFLEQRREEWMVEERHLKPLQRRAPAQPRYFGPRRERGTLVRRWNLIVPKAVLERAWEEPG